MQPSFTNDLDQGKVDVVVINTKDQTVEVTTSRADGSRQYSVNYTDPAHHRAPRPVPP